MKKIKFLATLLAAGALVACNETIEPQGSGENTPTTGEGYVKVAINMPTTSGTVTKSTDNGEVGANVDLEDGVANEYNVSNGLIAFFKAANTAPEADATFAQAYQLDLGNPASGPADQVTTRYSTITEAPLVNDNEQLYALVILNYDGTTINFSGSTLKIGTTTISDDKKLSDFQGKLTAELSTFIGDGSNKFTMTNAPLSNKAGIDGFDPLAAKAYTLVPVTVYDTEAEAQAAAPASIYVERVVSKVTLKGFNPGDHTKTVAGSEDVVALTGWALNVTNKSTKLVRDVAGYNSTEWLTSDDSNVPKRFAGTNAISADFNVDSENTYYRIYWAKDCNYSESYNVADEFTTYSNTQEPAWASNTADDAESDTDYALYCLENTMDYKNQNQNQTTGVLLKTTYMPKFDGQDKAEVQDFFICGTSATKYPVNTISSSSGGALGFCDHVKAEAVLSEDVAIKTDAEGGTYSSADELKKLIVKTDQSALTDADYTKIWNAIGTVYYYKKGTAYYYSALIRHFQDEEGVEHSNGENYSVKHLGRYGVVRNNWYELNVNSISGPGDPEIPDPEGPNDETEGYINCTINVLSWAKRSQDVDL